MYEIHFPTRKRKTFTVPLRLIDLDVEKVLREEDEIYQP